MIGKKRRDVKSTLYDLMPDRRKLIRYILIILLAVMVPLISREMRRLVFLLAIVGVNFILAYSKRFIMKVGISNLLKGIELVMFSTVVTGFAFGPGIAMLIGGICMAINYIAERRFSVYFIVTLPLYMAIGFLSGAMRGLNIIAFGIAATLLYNAASIAIIVPFLGGKPRSLFMFAASNILFNLMLFLNLAAPLLSVLSI